MTLDDITITKGSFPATPDKADQYLQALRSSAPQQMADLSFEHLKAEIAVTQAESAPQKPVAVKNDAPKIYYSSQPAMLVQVDGQPVLRQVPGYNLLRVINTYAVILFNQSQGTYYLRAVELSSTSASTRCERCRSASCSWSACRSGARSP